MKLANIREFTAHILITLLIIGIFIAVLITLKINADFNAKQDLNPTKKLQCEYYDSINITDGLMIPNGDIIYKNVTFPKGQYARVDTALRFDEKKSGHFIKVAPYYRGCLCNRDGVKCVRLCCKEGPCMNHAFENNFQKELKKSGKFNTLIDNGFNIVTESCVDFGKIETGPQPNITDDGLLITANKTYNHKDYCFFTKFVENPKNSLNFIPKISPKNPLVECHHDEVKRAQKKLNKRREDVVVPYLLFTSVPFTVATFLVYIVIPELRNLHGKCLLCYLFNLAVFQSFFGWIYINGETYVQNRIFCKFAGFTTYLSVQSAFLWLSVISFDLWWNFRKTSGFMLSERRRFLFYSIYSWGIAVLLTLIIVIMDNVNIPDEFKPNMAQEHQMCYFKPGFTSRLIYFYMPQLILCSLNILFFVLTALKIRSLQNDLSKIMAQDESCKHQCKFASEKENFTLFLRLFIVMGVVWIMEGISFLVGSRSIYFFIFDMWNCLQGVLIFAFMVCKRRVCKLIKKRYHVIVTNGAFLSFATNSSSMANAPTNSVSMNQMPANREKYAEKA